MSSELEGNTIGRYEDLAGLPPEKTASQGNSKKARATIDTFDQEMREMRAQRTTTSSQETKKCSNANGRLGAERRPYGEIAKQRGKMIDEMR